MLVVATVGTATLVILAAVWQVTRNNLRATRESLFEQQYLLVDCMFRLHEEQLTAAGIDPNARGEEQGLMLYVDRLAYFRGRLGQKPYPRSLSAYQDDVAEIKRLMAAA